MKTYYNQKTVITQKEKCDREHLYMVSNISALDQAMFYLKTTGAIKLWIYLAKNQDKYTFALSSLDFMRWSGQSKKAYDKGVEELIANGYLILEDAETNTWVFHDKAENKIDMNIRYPAEKVKEIQEQEECAL